MTEAERIAEARQHFTNAARIVREVARQVEIELGAAYTLLEPIAGESLEWWMENDDSRPITEAESLLLVATAPEEPAKLRDIAENFDNDLAKTDAHRYEQYLDSVESSKRTAREFDEREAQARAAGVHLEALAPEDRRLFRLPPEAFSPALRQRRADILAAWGGVA